MGYYVILSFWIKKYNFNYLIFFDYILLGDDFYE